MDYPVFPIEKLSKFRMPNDYLLCEWETANPNLLGGLLARPETHSERHYTGIILKRGEYVTDENLKVGERVLWEQFSGFEKFQSPDGKKRYAFVKESACLCCIPKRTKVAVDDWTVYGEGEE